MVVALGVLDALLTEPVDGVGVAHAHERSLRALELGVVLLDGSGGGGVLEGDVDDTADDVLKMAEKVVELDEVELSLDVGVLGKLELLGWIGLGE